MNVNLLEGKTAVVTGAGSGMGKEIAKVFGSQGANVVLADLNEEAARRTASEIELKKRVLVVPTNVAQDDSVQDMVRQTTEAFGDAHILINCAGVPQFFTPIEELQLEEWDKIMAVNSKSIFLTTRHLVPLMKQKESGVIINIASIAGERARPGLNAYCASKGAALMLTKALALELAPYGIRVNAINPGPAETPMLGRFLPGDAQKVEEDKKKIFLDSVPMGRLIQPHDIAQAALYLSSDLAKAVTGEVLNVDGGRGV
ncbi:SDR family oxidoreductase [Fictibacillus enclensis]|uniref:SDR family oxidoreductase n=1 Tax=Fictibacillus enclensis TaxID=1017270 RepID=UPI0025A04439|nr:SDR family oxidoreductase [Fictibacillus enclensis]MDM5199386.1 SDR family oxidoreductase [Fictibacillus enclensis]